MKIRHTVSVFALSLDFALKFKLFDVTVVANALLFKGSHLLSRLHIESVNNLQ